VAAVAVCRSSRFIWPSHVYSVHETRLTNHNRGARGHGLLVLSCSSLHTPPLPLPLL